MGSKSLILGITGCIAAYKAPDIARKFIKNGWEVNVVMSRAATKFITPLTLETVTGNPVTTDLFTDKDFKHLDLARKASLVLIAPATANIIAKAAAGLADDAISTVFLAAKCPKAVAPAMNFRMYENSVTQRNIGILKKNGVLIIEPEEGSLACGEEGKGRLAATATVFKKANDFANKAKTLQGKRFLVTAGPTMEKIDAVRCITNLSSGKAGAAIAGELYLRGGEVEYLTSVPENAPAGVSVNVFSGIKDLKEKLEAGFKKADCLVMTAAVSDFAPDKEADGKIKRKKSLELRLNPTEDLLMTLSAKKGSKKIVGFAAETSNIEHNAVAKLKSKELDMLIASDVTKKDSGIGSDYCDFWVYFNGGGKKKLGRQLKTDAAVKIADLIAEVI